MAVSRTNVPDREHADRVRLPMLVKWVKRYRRKSGKGTAVKQSETTYAHHAFPRHPFLDTSASSPCFLLAVQVCLC